MAIPSRFQALLLVIIVLTPSALSELAAEGARGIDQPSGQDGPDHVESTMDISGPSNDGPLAQAARSVVASRPALGSSGSERVCPSDGTIATGPLASSYPAPGTVSDGGRLGPETSAEASRARLPAPVRSGPDVSPILIEYVGPDPSIGKFGAAQVGKPTQFNVTIRNGGDADASPVSLRITINDYFGNVVGDYNTSITSIAAGANATAYWKYWTPAFCTQFSVNATASASGDANITNNTLLLTGLWADKWIDICDSTTGWTGDMGPGQWMITTTDPWPAGHSGPGSWHCGQAGYYLNDTDASIVSPPIDLSRMNPTYYILFDMNYHGDVENGDAVTVYISDNDGNTWYSIFAPSLDAKTAMNGWYSWVSHWVDNDGDKVVDDNEPHQDGLDISEFCGRTIRIRFRFTSDGAYNAEGFYLDDMVVRGWENQNDVALLGIAAARVERLGVEQTFNTTMRNLGQGAQGSFVAHMNISDGTSINKSVGAMQPGELRTVSWTWTPALPGNFTAQCTILPGQDEVPGDNSLWRPVHVAAGPAGTLLVDDDSGPGNNGALRGMTGTDVEWAEEDALTFTEYDSYLVGDGDGPPLGVMQDYGLVIWVTGYDDLYSSRAGTLTAADRSNLAAYMDGGGRFMLVSFETMWDVWTVWGDQDFIINNLHIMSFSSADDDQGMPNFLDGLLGDPVTDGIHFETADPPAGLWDKTDRLSNASDSPGIFYQYDYAKDPLSGPFNGLRHNGKTKFVFLAFELGFIKMPDDRALLMRRALDWLWGGVVLSPGKGGVQGTATPTGNVSYNITLACEDERSWKVESLGPATVPPGWGAVCDMAVANGTPAILVSPAQPLALRLTVTVPAGAPAGSPGDISVAVRMVGSPFSLYIFTRTTVLPVSGVNLSCARPVQTAQAGEQLIFMVSVVNTGNQDDRFDLSLRGEVASWCQLSRSSLFISGGGGAFVQVAADLPQNAPAGGHDLTVRAQASNGTEPVRAELLLTISVNASRNLKIEGSPPGKVVNMAETLNAVIPVEISNYGNVEETAIVSLCATFSGWQQWQLSSPQRQMAPFEKAVTVKVDVTVPSTAAAGYYNLTVQVGYANGDVADRRNTVIELRVPDLAIFTSDVRLSPSRPLPGWMVEFSALIRNNGTADARNISVAFTLNNKTAGVWRVSEAVAPGQAVTASVFYRGIKHGDNLLTVSVDPDGALVESSKQNNLAELHVFGYQSDLSVGAISFHAVGRAQPKDNRSVSEGMVEVSAVIYNGGEYCLDADNVEVNFSVNGMVFETRVVSVAGNSQAVATALWFSKKGSSQLRVTVDPGNRIEETAEGNNEAVFTVKVQAKEVVSTDMGQWVPVIGGIIAVVIIATALAYRSVRSKGRPAPPPKLEGMRSYRAKAGSSRPCSKCGKPIEAGTGYLKCEECDARYHPECASAGICHHCAEREVGEEKDGATKEPDGR